MYKDYGYWLSSARGRRLHLHRNPGLELVYVSAGTMDWEVDGNPERVGPRTLFFTLPWQLHGSHHIAPVGAEIRWLVIPAAGGSDEHWTFDPQLQLPFSDQEYRRLRRAFDGRKHAIACGDRGDEFASLMRMSTEAIDQNDELLVKSLVHAVVCQAVRIIESAPAQQLDGDCHGDDSLLRVRQWVQAVSENPLAYQFELEVLAAKVGLARSRFAQLVRQETGDSPSRFVTRQRVHMAARLLRATRRSVTDIAFSCDFSSTQHFAKVFTRYLGESPSVYRTNNAG